MQTRNRRDQRLFSRLCRLLTVAPIVLAFSLAGLAAAQDITDNRPIVGYYVDDGLGSHQHVNASSKGVKAKYWRIEVYRFGMPQTSSNHETTICGESAAQVLAELRKLQAHVKDFEEFLERTHQMDSSFKGWGNTYNNWKGPIAVVASPFNKESKAEIAKGLKRSLEMSFSLDQLYSQFKVMKKLIRGARGDSALGEVKTGDTVAEYLETLGDALARTHKLSMSMKRWTKQAGLTFDARIAAVLRNGEAAQAALNELAGAKALRPEAPIAQPRPTGLIWSESIPRFRVNGGDSWESAETRVTVSGDTVSFHWMTSRIYTGDRATAVGDSGEALVYIWDVSVPASQIRATGIQAAEPNVDGWMVWISSAVALTFTSDRNGTFSSPGPIRIPVSSQAEAERLVALFERLRGGSTEPAPKPTKQPALTAKERQGIAQEEQQHARERAEQERLAEENRKKAEERERQAKIERAREEKATIERELIVLRPQRDDQQLEIVRLEGELDLAGSRVAMHKSAISSATRSIKSAEENIERVQGWLDHWRESVRTTEGAARAIAQIALNDTERSMESAQKRLRKYEDALEEAETAKAEADDKKREATSNLDRGKGNLERTESKISDAEGRLRAIGGNLTAGGDCPSLAWVAAGGWRGRDMTSSIA